METPPERGPIEHLISAFEEAFNAGNVANIVALYTADGVVMPNNAPQVQGQSQIKALYEQLLNTFDININYQVKNVVISGDYAFAHTGSQVTTRVRATGTSLSLENKELFIFHQANNQWKIASYIFNSNHTN